MKIKSVESTFPTRVGMTISGCKGNFYSGNGSRYAMVVGTNESSHNIDKIVSLIIFRTVLLNSSHNYITNTGFLY